MDVCSGQITQPSAQRESALTHVRYDVVYMWKGKVQACKGSTNVFDTARNTLAHWNRRLDPDERSSGYVYAITAYEVDAETGDPSEGWFRGYEVVRRRSRSRTDKHRKAD